MDTVEPRAEPVLETVVPASTRPRDSVSDPASRARVWFYVLVGVVLSLLHLLVIEKIGPFARIAKPLVARSLLAAGLIAGIVAITRAVDDFVIERVASIPARYNLRRIASLVRAILIGTIAVSTLFATWYTALVSLGVGSLILGFALQTPITSFIGWIYVLVKNPYRVGDRVRVGDAAGDVIDVSFLDTTVWEIGGPLVSTEDPSGRVIRIPNSLALSNAVYNCTAARFPYVWNEVTFLVGYGSDLEFVARTMTAAAGRHLTPAMRERMDAFRKLAVRTPIDVRALDEKPRVHFRSHESSWLEAVVRYLVDPHDASATKDAIVREVLQVLDAASDRVLLPQGAER